MDKGIGVGIRCGGIGIGRLILPFLGDKKMKITGDNVMVGEEMLRHMYHLWSLSGGRIGKRPPGEKNE